MALLFHPVFSSDERGNTVGTNSPRKGYPYRIKCVAGFYGLVEGKKGETLGEREAEEIRRWREERRERGDKRKVRESSASAPWMKDKISESRSSHPSLWSRLLVWGSLNKR